MKEKRKKYVDINNERQKPQNGHLTAKQKTSHVMAVIGTTFLSIMLILVITICIVAVALTVYIMQFAENSFDIDLKDVELSFNSFMYATDKSTGEYVTLKQLNTDQNRVWVEIEDMPQHLIDAVVAVEDKRFFEHDGVDWTRTVAATVGALLSGGTEGGSTVTQQLVRDVTGDNNVNVGRKLREIFRALSLEQKYTKLDILESYLNRIGFGGTSYGVGSAARHYFDKDVSELTIAESAILAGIIRSPGNYNPYSNLYNTRERQKYALTECMYEQGLINTAEYEEALNEKVRFRRPVKGDDFGYIDERYNEYYGIQDSGDAEEDDLYYENEDWLELRSYIPYKWNGDYEVSQSWYDDACINQVVSHLAELKGISETSARDILYSGGYKIYSNVDLEMQEKLSEIFIDPYTCLRFYDPAAERDDLLQGAFVIMDFRGNVAAVAGGIGEKEGDNCYNLATQSLRAIGSTIKPISVYGPAVDMNLITYSTMFRDISGEIDDEDNPGEKKRWPYNYEETFPGSGYYYPAWFAVQRSLNTIAVRTLSLVGFQNAYSMLTDRLGFSSMDPSNDMSWSPLALGGLTNGVRLYELAAAYQIFGNGGVYYEPYFYSKVEDSNGKVILEQNNMGVQAIGSDSAWIVNRMMKKVIEDPSGSGQHAVLPNVEVIGKTGTANDMSNLLFCGLTPDYVGVYRIGYDDHREIAHYSISGWETLARVWNKVMGTVTDTETERSFTPDSSVLTLNYCTETGKLATSKCPNTAIGYYRQSNYPESCDDPSHDGKYWLTHGDELNYIPYYKT